MTHRDLLADRYELRGLLGSGGMAEVHDGWDTRLNRPVAVKLLHPALQAQSDVRARFAHEARAAAGLTHPNIVAVHDYGEDDGTPFIVMERLPGTSLADLIDRGALPPPQVRAMLGDVLAALEVAHAAGVLHRDIKPGNILLSATGDAVKVADFGIAKTGGAAHTATGQVVGTMAYLSPERVAGAPASVADDLYAVGLMGYEALIGARAFPQDTPIALARAIIDCPPPPIGALRGDDPVLAGVIDRAMTRDPQQRFATAGQMRAALAGDPRALLTGAAPAMAPPRPATRVLEHPLGPPPPAMPSHRRRSTRRGVAAAGVLAAFAVAAAALAMGPFSSAPAQEPVSTSTAVPPPPPPPSPTPPPPTVAPVADEPPPPPAPKVGKPDKPGKGEGRGRGNGNGKGRG